MSDKFVAKKVQFLTPSCDTCTRRDPKVASNCTAFPNGIPYQIIVGEHDHKTPFPGDNGLTYLPKK